MNTLIISDIFYTFIQIVSSEKKNNPNLLDFQTTH